MKKNNEKGKFKIKYIIFLIALAVVTILLSLSLYFFMRGGRDVGQLVRSETVYVIIALLALLPVLLIVLITAVLVRRKKNAQTEIVISSVNIDAPAAATAQPAEEKIEESDGRFDGLSRIDDQRERDRKSVV